MTPTVVDEEDERDEDNISTDVDDDNVQGAGALPHTVSVNLQKSAIIYVDFDFLGLPSRHICHYFSYFRAL